jgi:hypothetical protein
MVRKRMHWLLGNPDCMLSSQRTTGSPGLTRASRARFSATESAGDAAISPASSIA